MPSGKSRYLQNKVLDLLYGNTAYSVPGTVYIALFTVAPTATTSGTEVTGGSYARVAVTNNTTNFPNASGGSKSNGTDWDFGTATADWGVVVAGALMDAASGGNMLSFATLTSSRDVKNGDSFKVAAGNATITET